MVRHAHYLDNAATANLPTTGPAILPNDALTDALFDAQGTGIPTQEADLYTQATVWFDPDATDTQTDVLVLNAFAVIALLAASFGIVNTLLMWCRNAPARSA